ncbi:helix-turn-helix domain-containing protein [Brucella pituitosa]|uniref:helix-turn-helix domain-containing protein n=1 Tax=Brucella pituitosa TaxID=571256 RepID=UPI003F4A8AD9
MTASAFFRFTWDMRSLPMQSANKRYSDSSLWHQANYRYAVAYIRYVQMSEFRDRVKEAADAVGGLNKLAELIGMPRRTLGDQLAGKTEPKMSLLVETARVTGFNIEWLATGNGPKSSQDRPMELLKRLTSGLSRNPSLRAPESAKIPLTDHLVTEANLIDPSLLENLVVLAKSVHDEFGIKLPVTKATAEAASLYNELSARVSNLKDRDEIEANLPFLRFQLKKRLEAASAAPGTGKRQA